MWELEEKLLAQTDHFMKETESQETQTEDLSVRPHCEEQASQTEGLQENTQQGPQENMYKSGGSQHDVVEQVKSQREEELIQELALLKAQYEGQDQAKSQREETLMQELASLQSQHEELEEKLQDVTKNWEDAEEKVLELTHCLEVTKGEIDNMTQRLEESETEAKHYQRQIESLQRSMTDMTDQKEHEVLSNQCQELEMKIKTLTNENENLHTSVAEKEKQVLNLKQVLY